MKNTMLIVAMSVVFLAGCENRKEATTLHTAEAPSVILPAGEPVPSEEVVDVPVDEALYEFDSDGILICDENEYGACKDGDMQDIRGPQLKAKHYRDNAAYVEPTEEGQGDIIEAHEMDNSDYEVVEVVRESGPFNVWGRDLSNYMTTYPQQTEAKYGDAELIISGMVSEVYADGVSIGGTFLGISNQGIEKNDNITVYCHGVYAGGTWGISAIAQNCRY